MQKGFLWRWSCGCTRQLTCNCTITLTCLCQRNSSLIAPIRDYTKTRFGCTNPSLYKLQPFTHEANLHNIYKFSPYFENRHSSVGLVTMLRSVRSSKYSIPTVSIKFYLFRNVYPGYGTHSVSHLVGTSGGFSSGKAAFLMRLRGLHGDNCSESLPQSKRCFSSISSFLKEETSPFASSNHNIYID